MVCHGRRRKKSNGIVVWIWIFEIASAIAAINILSTRVCWALVHPTGNAVVDETTSNSSAKIGHDRSAVARQFVTFDNKGNATLSSIDIEERNPGDVQATVRHYQFTGVLCSEDVTNDHDRLCKAACSQYLSKCLRHFRHGDMYCACSDETRPKPTTDPCKQSDDAVDGTTLEGNCQEACPPHLADTRCRMMNDAEGDVSECDCFIGTKGWFPLDEAHEVWLEEIICVLSENKGHKWFDRCQEACPYGLTGECVSIVLSSKMDHRRCECQTIVGERLPLREANAMYLPKTDPCNWVRLHGDQGEIVNDGHRCAEACGEHGGKCYHIVSDDDPKKRESRHCFCHDGHGATYPPSVVVGKLHGHSGGNRHNPCHEHPHRGKCHEACPRPTHGVCEELEEKEEGEDEEEEDEEDEEEEDEEEEEAEEEEEEDGGNGRSVRQCICWLLNEDLAMTLPVARTILHGAPLNSD